MADGAAIIYIRHEPGAKKKKPTGSKVRLFAKGLGLRSYMQL
jgi:hypothetical protein